MRARRRHAALWASAVLAAGAAMGAVAVGQGHPSTHTVTVAAYPVSVTAGTYRLYDFVVDFPPGSATPRHVHGGPVVVTVVTGELVLERMGGARVVKTGESFIEMPGDVHALRNRSAAPARIAAAELIPLGANETTVVK